MGMNMVVYQIVNEFKKLEEVVAITLAGSCASGRKDNYSDIDIDIITIKDVSLEKRRAIVNKFSDLIEYYKNGYLKNYGKLIENSDYFEYQSSEEAKNAEFMDQLKAMVGNSK